LPDGVDWNNITPNIRPPEVTLFEALEQQAGLKLVPDRGPVPVVIVDSVSRPEPN